jgi:flagellar protein FlaJ
MINILIVAQAMNEKYESLTEKASDKQNVSGFTVFRKKISFLIYKFKMMPYIMLGDQMKKREDAFTDLKKQLKQARIAMSYEMYLSNTIFYSVLAGLIGAFLGVIVSYIVIIIIGLPDQITHLTFGPSTAWILDYKELIVVFFIFTFLTIVLGGTTFILFLLYPQYLAGNRKGGIDRYLPFAVTFMYALSKSGMNIIEVFRSISASRHTYGEVSKEVDVILRDMDYFGNDLRTALYNISELTPSSNFQDLMYNLLTVIDSGGDIPTYFRGKSEQFTIKAKFEQKGFLETLALIAESYVTAFVAGPLFIIIMGVMMSVMGSDTTVMLYAIIYMVLPVGSFMFIFMISIMTPGATGEPPLLPTEQLLPDKIELPPKDDPEYGLFKSFIASRKKISIKKLLKNPFKFVKEKPVYILLLTVPITLIFLISSLFGALAAPNFIDFIDDRLVYSVYLLFVPLAFFYELKRHKEKKIQSQIPDFLKKMASTNETGMALRDSIALMARSRIGYLSKHIQNVWKDMDWGLDVNTSLARFSNRIRTNTVVRSITLITRANESSGDLGDVLVVAAKDAQYEQEMQRERNTNMLIYIVIIYISFAVFIGVVFVISTTFLSEMAKAGEQMTQSGAQGGGFMQAFDVNVFNRLFFHAAVIQGICSGLIAGVMGEGSVLSGLKHSIIMLTMGYLLFTVAVL